MKVLVLDDLRAKGIHHHRDHLREMAADGRFPQPIEISPQRIGWYENEVDDWLANRPRRKSKPRVRKSVRRRPPRTDA